MSKVTEQMENITVLDEEENDEITAPWEIQQEQLSEDEKLIKFKDLFAYKNSDEYKALIDFCNTKVDEQNTITRDMAFSRTETKAIKSIIDEYVAMYRVFEEIAKKITNKTFKEYFTEYRMPALESVIVKKKGIVDRNGATIPVDMPIYTELDISKEIASAYYSIEQFFNYCISVYDVKNKLEPKEVKEENPHQPYN